MRVPPNGRHDLTATETATDAARQATETRRQTAALALDAWQRNARALAANARALAIIESERRYSFEAFLLVNARAPKDTRDMQPGNENTA